MKVWITALALAASTISAMEFTYTQNDNSGNNIALGFPVPLPVESLTPIDGFRTYNSLHLRHEQLSAQASWLNQHQLGTTVQNRVIWGYHLSDDDDLTVGGVKEGSALINGGIHAREWQSPEALTGFMEKLFDRQSNQHIEQYILENLNLVLIPVLNIDGFLQTQRFPTTVTNSEQSPRDGRMRRKNMLNVDESLATTNDNLNGVDLNRNNDPYWATNSARSSSDQTSIVHHGSTAASEPEIQALHAGASLADTDRLRFYIDAHSFTQIYFTPFTGDNRRDAIAGDLAFIMRAANDFKYQYGPSASGGGIGSTDEYFANTFQIPSYTLEIEPLNSGADYGGFGVSHDGFILPASEVQRMQEETAKATFSGLYAMAELPFLQQLIIKEDGNTVFDIQWTVANGQRERQIAINNELSADTEYQLTLIFNKPMRQLEEEQPVAFSNLSGANDISLNWQINDGTNERTVEVPTNEGVWLTDNFNSYKTDSYQVNVTLPSDFDWQAASLLTLSVETTDMVGQSLDANPETITDWQNGHWENYESSNGELEDSGGIDRSMRLIDDGSALFTAPPAPPSTPSTPTPPANNATDSSGGSMPLWLTSLLMLCFFRNNKFRSKMVRNSK